MSANRFEADVRQILHLVTHSLYSDREIFLRELISNASDALDKARFVGLQEENLRSIEGDPEIALTFDADEGTLTISDNGIGLTEEEAVEHLGTIARSGTSAFAEALKEKGESSHALIGQFGVGFYSAFMVAEEVTVESLSARPDTESIVWTSDGGEDQGGAEANGAWVLELGEPGSDADRTSLDDQPAGADLLDGGDGDDDLTGFRGADYSMAMLAMTSSEPATGGTS